MRTPERWRDLQAERFGGLTVDQELELRRLRHGKVSWVGTLRILSTNDAPSWRCILDDDVHLAANEFSRERRQLIGLPLGEPGVNGDILAFHPTEVAEPLAQGIQVGPITVRRSLG